MKDKTPTETEAELRSAYGAATLSFTTAKTWSAKLKRDGMNIFNEEHSGRSKTATTNEMIDYVHEIVINDLRLTSREIAEAPSISYEWAPNI